MMSQEERHFLEQLSRAFQSSDWTLAGLRRVAAQATRSRAKWVQQLSEAVATQFANCPREETLVRFLHANEIFKRLWLKAEVKGTPLVISRIYPPILRMWPTNIPLLGAIPAFLNLSDVAKFCKLTPRRLYWYADLTGLNRLASSVRFRHYFYEWKAKHGTGPIKRYRLLESPTSGLKRVQRILLHKILNLIPTHRAAHGFVPGRSIRTHAENHTGKALVIRFDLADFFPSISFLRVRAIFRAIGYSSAIAKVLGALCTTRLPSDIWEKRPSTTPGDFNRELLFQRWHLPQGAPTSPALGNLAAFRLDVRLSALSEKLGVNYTRYADDLTFSGDQQFVQLRERFMKQVATIVADEGFVLNPSKTKIMFQGQRQEITGLVVNTSPNIQRKEYDELKAILTNSYLYGPQSQNRDNRADFKAYLQGRVAFFKFVNPARGAKLQAKYDRIVWP